MRRLYLNTVLFFLIGEFFIPGLGFPLFSAEIGIKKPDQENSRKPILTWDFLWTGSLANSFKTEDSGPDAELLFEGSTLVNRGEIILGLPGPGLKFRLQGIDRFKLPSFDNHLFNPGFGLYMDSPGTSGLWGNSSLLYGILDEYGLPARIKNVWAKSPPFAENRKPTMSDLKTDPSSHDSRVYLYLGFPGFGDSSVWGSFSGYVSAQTENDFFPALGGGLEFRKDLNFNIMLEVFYTRFSLEPRKPQTWFSVNPALPKRDFHLFGIGSSLNLHNLGFAMDLAISETFAWGRDFYGNAALRIGSKPWKFSIAIDGAGSRYTGRDGNVPGQNLRIAARLERSWTRSGLFRFDAAVRLPQINGNFNRGSLYLYFRPSAPPPRQVPFFRITRASLSLGRNASTPQKTEDSLDAVLGFNIAFLRMVLTGSLDSRTVLNADEIFIYLPPFFAKFDSAKISLETGWSYKNLNLSIKSGYMFRAEKENIWDFSLYGSFRIGKIGRVSLKIAASEFPVKWNYTLSWRVGRISF